MSPSIRESLREEIDHWWVLAAVGIVVVFAGVLDATAAELAVVLAVLHAEKGSTVAEAAGVVREWVAEAASALAAVGGAGILWALGSDPSLAFVVLFAGVRSGYGAAKTVLAASGSGRDGAARATDRAGSVTDRAGSTDRAVRSALEDRARTRREVREAVDADPDAVDAALVRLRDRGAVERAGSEYRVAPEPDPGFVERLRSLVPGGDREAGSFGGDTDGTVDSYKADRSPVTSVSGRSAGADSGRGSGGREDALGTDGDDTAAGARTAMTDASTRRRISDSAGGVSEGAADPGEGE
ncbi:hypothetical protein [Halosimplex marinum]|uniref:hypothetical protein n=1 Tax=Halosimplex marinum TaxID=3396620 RepID=UPI003F5672DF